ncbi:hypothetical protein ADUPG1_006390 [Aduncisulcus paluster]|uniref:Uncharacterized protein n=1 Tax=Aduncisulcus paluster TaxID=2918883 RepID=A0ABQ5KMM6_9EUKA|nr:hypothetical protein ADUPG1_006390 [Aduncisulcus paluster]
MEHFKPKHSYDRVRYLCKSYIEKSSAGTYGRVDSPVTRMLFQFAKEVELSISHLKAEHKRLEKKLKYKNQIVDQWELMFGRGYESIEKDTLDDLEMKRFLAIPATELPQDAYEKLYGKSAPTPADILESLERKNREIQTGQAVILEQQKRIQELERDLDSAHKRAEHYAKRVASQFAEEAITAMHKDLSDIYGLEEQQKRELKAEIDVDK